MLSQSAREHTGAWMLVLGVLTVIALVVGLVVTLGILVSSIVHGAPANVDEFPVFEVTKKLEMPSPRQVYTFEGHNCPQGYARVIPDLPPEEGRWSDILINVHRGGHTIYFRGDDTRGNTQRRPTWTTPAADGTVISILTIELVWCWKDEK